MSGIAGSISELRKQCGFTQKNLAEKVGVSIQTVSKWEKGISSPDINLLPAIADALGISIDRLFNRDRETVRQDIDESYREVADLIARRIKFAQSKLWYPESEGERSRKVDEMRELFCENPSSEAGYGLPYTKIMYYSPDTGFAGIDDVGTVMFPDETDEFLEFLSKKTNRRVLDLLLLNGRRRHISVEFIASKLDESRENIQSCMDFLMKYGIMEEIEVPLECEKNMKIYKWDEPAKGTRQYVMIRVIAAFSKKFMTCPTKYVAFIG